MYLLRALVRRARAGEDGAVAVEAAIIILPLLIIVFGIIDFGLLIKDDVAVTSAVRAISRTASIQAPLGSGTLTPTDGGTGQTFFTSIATQAQAATAGLDRVAAGPGITTPTAVYIFLLTSPTATPPSGTSPPCSGDCVKLTWNGSSFANPSGSWVASHVNACSGTATPISQVDVVFTTPHTILMPIPGVFRSGSTFQLSSNSVLYFEPVPAQPGPCKGS